MCLKQVSCLNQAVSVNVPNVMSCKICLLVRFFFNISQASIAYAKLGMPRDYGARRQAFEFLKDHWKPLGQNTPYLHSLGHLRILVDGGNDPTAATRVATFTPG